MELVPAMYNVHPYFSLKYLGKSAHYTQQNRVLEYCYIYSLFCTLHPSVYSVTTNLYFLNP